MKLILALLLAFASCGAFAAGVPLFDFNPAQLRPQEEALRDRLAAESVRKVNVLNINRSAFHAGTVTVSINNKTYRFVGGPIPPSKVTPTVIRWSGSTGNALDRLYFAEDTEGGIVGSIDVDGHHLTIHGMNGATAVLVIERQDVPTNIIFPRPQDVTPVSKSASRP